MAVRIEKGGWLLIFLVGLGLVGYALNKYGVLTIPGLPGGKKSNFVAVGSPDGRGAVNVSPVGGLARR